MNDSAELLALRLGLIGIVFLFVLIAALTMRSGLRTTRVLTPASRREQGGSGSRLVLVSAADTGYEPGTEFAVAGVMILGRDSGNGIVLGDSSVSGAHAQIERTARGWQLTDLGSTNGTLVNGRPVDGRGVALRGGERLTLGAVVLRFHP